MSLLPGSHSHNTKQHNKNGKTAYQHCLHCAGLLKSNATHTATTQTKQGMTTLKADKDKH